jgi:uncharacterized protein YegJ (DUF2314 family)
MTRRSLLMLLLTGLFTSNFDARPLRADEDVPQKATKSGTKKAAPQKKASEDDKAASEESDKDAPPPVSVVLLQTSLPKWSEQQLIAKIKTAWKVDLSQKDGEDNDEGFVVKGGPGFIIKTKDSQYMMIMAEDPYLKKEVIDEVEELRLKTMLKEHEAWVSVDLLSGDDELSPAAKAREWKRVASLAAELLNDKTIGVILPEPNVIAVKNETTADHLRQKDPVTALKDSLEVAVVGADSDDPEMEKAVEDARKSWSDFVKAFEAKAEGTDNFGVKFPFDAPENKEFMWVEVTSIDEEFVTGKLANDPVWVKDLQLGSRVKRKVSEIADWMYIKDGDIVGGYSVKVLLKRQAEEQAKESESN